MLESWLPQTPAPLLFAGVTLAARYGGLGPGLLSTLICALGLGILLDDPMDVPDAGGSALLHLAVFVLVAMLVSTLTERMHRAEAQARADAIRLSILAEASRAFTAAIPDHQTTLQAVARQMGGALGDACVISLLSEDGQWLSHAAWYHRDPVAQGLWEEMYGGQQHLANEGLAGRALREDRPVNIATDHPDEVPRASRAAYAPFLKRFPVYSIISVPLRTRDRSIGTLTLWRSLPGQPFTPADQDLLQELAHRSAMAIESARLSVYYQALFEQAPEPTVVLDADHQLLDANPAATELLGDPLEDLRKRRIDTLMSSDTDSLASIYEGLRSHGRWHGELDLQCADGGTVPVEASAVVVQLLTGPVYVWVWHDLTQQRSLQQMRDDFVSSTSHELRTPLTAALAALGLMQQPGSGELQPAHRELVDNAMRNVLRLRILVDDLLAEGQLRAQALGLNYQLFDLRQVILGAVEAMHSLLQRKGQRVELDVPEALPVNGDPRRMEQVFVNLLANANQHTPKGTRIEITGRISEGEVWVSVCDDGPGIPVEHADRIFERFSRIGATGSGTGLGLAIAHDFVRMHDGRICAENTPDGGAAFQIALPSHVDGG